MLKKSSSNLQENLHIQAKILRYTTKLINSSLVYNQEFGMPLYSQRSLRR